MTSFPLVPLRFLSALPITNGLGEAAADGDESWPRYIRTTDISGLDRLDPAKRVTLPPHVAAAAPVLRDDILMTAAGSLGTAYHHASDEPACYAGYLVRWRIDPEKASPRFMAYWTQSKHHLDQIAVGAVRSTIDNFSASKFRAMQAPAPPLDQQRAIADFLDRETAQIDAMVDAQERLVALLEERRKAALLHGTLGRADTAWEGHLGRALRPLSRTPADDAEVVTAYRDGAVLRRSERRDDGYTFSDLEQGYQGVEVGDLVFHGLDGFAGAVGVASSSGKCSPVYHVAAATNIANNHYLAYLLRSLGLSGYLEANAWSVRQRSVDYRNWKQLAALWVQLPHPEVQRRVVRELEEQFTHIDAMIAKARESIALMKERRAAVISAAVTGRIDVRTGIEQVERDLEEARV